MRTSKNNCQKIIGIWFCLKKLVGPQNGQKQLFKSFSSVLLKQTKEQILLQVQPTYKNVFFLCAGFRVKMKIFGGLAPQKLATLKGDIFELSSYIDMAQLGKCPIKKQITPP